VKLQLNPWSSRVDGREVWQRVQSVGVELAEWNYYVSVDCVYSFLLLLCLPLVHRRIVVVARHARPHTNTRNRNIISAATVLALLSLACASPFGSVNYAVGSLRLFFLSDWPGRITIHNGRQLPVLRPTADGDKRMWRDSRPTPSVLAISCLSWQGRWTIRPPQLPIRCVYVLSFINFLG
jgi:hypothetical protein